MNRIGGDHDHESARADGDAALGKEFAEAFHGAAHALLRGVVGRAEALADFAQGFVLEIAEQHGGAVRTGSSVLPRVVDGPSPASALGFESSVFAPLIKRAITILPSRTS